MWSLFYFEIPSDLFNKMGLDENQVLTNIK